MSVHLTFLWTDEARFHLQGHVNIHVRIWAMENLLAHETVSLYSAKVTAFIFYHRAILFENIGPGRLVTCIVNVYDMRLFLSNHDIPSLQQFGYAGRLIFVQDDALSHIANPIK
ncbi:hypothetical protein CEXT_629001 [Caerostris extrusa]|uniref:Uncharacterized protein n=1 Tax=Caerostris extrusa TaxID=172846 RepID=A0AAV4SGL8_CAEEX|nr:hypothetical protein CEXT_629001 [Caerostris extrusa]